MEKEKDTRKTVWENLQVAVLMLTVAGQALVGGVYLLAQIIWMAANIIAFARNFALERPMADKVKDGAMCGLTGALIVLRLLGIY